MTTAQWIVLVVDGIVFGWLGSVLRESFQARRKRIETARRDADARKRFDQVVSAIFSGPGTPPTNDCDCPVCTAKRAAEAKGAN